MDVREKIVEILDDAGMGKLERNFLADQLIANGVTVQDGKPLDAFLHPVDAYKGLKDKYLVFKADTGERVGNCFVLRPDKDPAAVEAIRAYARATDNETLAEDIYNWVGKGEPVQEWISVLDRLPEESGMYIVTANDGHAQRVSFVQWQKKNRMWNLTGARSYWRVTHWQPMPQPPKGE